MTDLVKISQSIQAEIDIESLAQEFSRAFHRPALLIPYTECSAWLLGWRPGDTTEIHDHDSEQILVTVLRGELVEECFELYAPNEIVPCNNNILNGTVTVPADRIHRVTNRSNELGISLHLYAPRLTMMRLFTEVVSDGGTRLMCTAAWRE